MALLGRLLVLAVFAVVLPASAGAATYHGGYYRAEAGEANDLVVTTSGDRVILDDVVNVEPRGDAAPEEIEGVLTVGPHACTQLDSTKISCPARSADAMQIILSDGNDRLSYSNAAAFQWRYFVVFADGSDDAGRDTITVDDTATPFGGKYKGVQVQGGGGNDTIAGNVLGRWVRDRGAYRGRSFEGAYTGGNGNDRITCGALACGADGGPGRDVLIGGPGADVLHGGTHGLRRDLADTLRGNAGNDRLCGGPARDRIIGGPGDDAISLDSKYANRNRFVDRIFNDGGPGRDRLVGSTRLVSDACARAKE